ncbi:uncharacterized protein LOC121472541 isoform X2 [Vulpes lagopus]|uniref:uncharacterized protein LOC121472541 isoform X2 n=1 Tax=Vulpes lagopus TaxID=494514 RepID=UPI001BC93A61|nr:uncharacterized protein LOC121472541 isoform X2 [Vulpes lagopus]
MACALGGAGSGTRKLTVKEWFVSLSPTSPGPGPLLRVATSEEHTIACYKEGPAAAELASPGPIVHLRANDVEKQQVHGHSRAGLSSSALLCKLPPAPAPGPSAGGARGQLPISRGAGQFASQVPTSVNFPQIIPETHTRYAPAPPAPPAAGTYHIPRSSTDTLGGSKKTYGFVPGSLYASRHCILRTNYLRGRSEEKTPREAKQLTLGRTAMGCHVKTKNGDTSLQNVGRGLWEPLLAHLAVRTAVKRELRILKRDHPGLSKRALNPVTGVLIRERRTER